MNTNWELATECKYCDVDTSLVSIVIIFLNAEKYIREAIESVFSQTYKNWELLLVDDGSTDKSTEIARGFAEENPSSVKYLEHENHQNRGMSASRNLGIKNSQGSFLAFLDADDIWLPEKLQQQVNVLEQYPTVGLVFNPALYWYIDNHKHPQPVTIEPGVVSVGAWLPKILESSDNAACPSAVLMRKELATTLGGFEESFRGPLMMVEDQIMWFKTTLNSQIYYDPTCVLLYRIHAESCCGSISYDRSLSVRTYLYAKLLTLTTASDHPQAKWFTLMTQARFSDVLLETWSFLAHSNLTESLENPELKLLTERDAFSKYSQLLPGAFWVVLQAKWLSPNVKVSLASQVFEFATIAYRKNLVQAVIRMLPSVASFLLRGLMTLLRRCVRFVKRPVIRWKAQIQHLTSRVLLGFQVIPLSDRWGYDRGLPLHQYYIERFMREHSADIKGCCLEFQDDSYTSRFAGGVITKLDLLHVDDSNPKATIVGDLTGENDFPSDAFDCIICTHVLHVIYDFDRAIAELHRMLKPGGVLLVAVPKVSMCEPDEGELWRFTAEGLRQVLAKHFGNDNTTIQAYGNSLTSAGYLRGLVTSEFQQRELDYTDLRFATEICGRAVKH